MSAETVSERVDLQSAAARVRAMRPEEVDAVSDAEVRAMLQVVEDARRETEAAATESKQAEEDRRRLLVELQSEADAQCIAGARAAALAGAPETRRTAAEYRSWSDERIAMLRMDPEEQLSVLSGIDVGELGTTTPIPDWLIALEDEVAFDEPSPLLIASERLAVAQAASNRADAARVHAALMTWRTADALATGTPDAAVNGPYFASVTVQVAHDLQIAHETASAMIHAADDLDLRMPSTWGRFMRGEVPWRAMQRVHAELDGLDPAFLPAFDQGAAALLSDTAVPRLRDALRKLRERLQASTAEERHEKAKERMRVELEPAADGMAWLHALLPAAEAVHIDGMLDLAARQARAEDGETRSVQVLRATIVGDVFAEWLGQDASAGRDDVLVGQRRGVQCKVGLLIPAMTAMGHSDAPATLEGYGPIDITTAKRLAGDATSWIKVLTDPVSGAVWDIGRDKYRPTSDMRTLLDLLDQGGRGPSCRRPPRRTEADHVEPFWQHFARGRTALDNLVLLARVHHQIKTSGFADIELRPNRDLVWTSMAGTRIITTVPPLEPTPVPEDLLHPPTDVGGPAPEWAVADQPDELDVPF